jgi:hypothetical protein
MLLLKAENPIDMNLFQMQEWRKTILSHLDMLDPKNQY